jgi:hypothetical protein
MIAPIFALLSSKGILATVYSVRAIVSTLILLILMLRVELNYRKIKTESKKSEITV